MSHVRHMESDVLFAKRSCIIGIDRRSIHRVPIRCVARSERTSRRTGWRTAAPAGPPEPTSAAPAERLQRAVGVEHLDGGAGLRMDVEERLTAQRAVRTLASPAPSRRPLSGLGKGQAAQVVRSLGCLAAGCKERPFVGLQKLNP